jgi:hypothetical protein
MRAQVFVNEDLTRRGYLRGLGAADAAGASGGALAQAKPVDASKEFQNMRQDDPRVRHAQDVNDLAKVIYQNMVAERGQPADRREQNKWIQISHLKAEARFAQYKPGAQTAAKPAAGFPSQGSEYRKARDINNFESVAEEEQLDELTFMGMSPCTKDCSGHRAGYRWSKARGGVSTASQSNSFNKGAEIARAGY